jgi:hypothetical protein
MLVPFLPIYAILCTFFTGTFLPVPFLPVPFYRYLFYRYLFYLDSSGTCRISFQMSVHLMILYFNRMRQPCAKRDFSVIY